MQFWTKSGGVKTSFPPRAATTCAAYLRRLASDKSTPDTGSLVSRSPQLRFRRPNRRSRTTPPSSSKPNKPSWTASNPAKTSWHCNTPSIRRTNRSNSLQLTTADLHRGPSGPAFLLVRRQGPFCCWKSQARYLRRTIAASDPVESTLDLLTRLEEIICHERSRDYRSDQGSAPRRACAGYAVCPRRR